MSTDRETIIVDRGGSGSGAAIIGGIAIVVLLVVGYFVFFNGRPAGGTVDVDVPAVSVDVVPDGQ